MNILGAIIAGVPGTIAISSVMAIAPMMGMPKMDIVEMLSTMFGRPNRLMGWMMHFMMGIVFALIYIFLWSVGVGSPTWVNGLIFGGVHWLFAGLVMGMIPMMHVGIKRGEVQVPGLWMTNNGGMLAFGGGLIGHLVFGLVVVLVYNLF
jgi:hypothetical protein